MSGDPVLRNEVGDKTFCWKTVGDMVRRLS